MDFIAVSFAVDIPWRSVLFFPQLGWFLYNIAAITRSVIKSLFFDECYSYEYYALFI